MMRRHLLTLLVLAAGLAPATASPLSLEVVERTMPNGLRVLVHVDRDIPNVALYTTWKVGSRNEVPGITGLAHFFEHMMFTGSARYGRDFDPVMEAAGGSNNAYTTRDVTAYQDWFPADRLELILDMEHDRMRGMVFADEVVESEREVVASEHRSTMEDPAAVLDVELWAAAYTAHPYQWDVLGWMSDVENWKKSDLEEFFRRHYAPENATMVFAGDVDPEEVFRLVGERMGQLPRGPGRRPIHTREPAQRGERRVVVRHEGASLPQVMIAWHIPETRHPDFPALDVAERILLHGESSRLHRLLVEEERLALEVGGGWQAFQFDPSLFAVDAKLREGKDPAALERLVYAAFRRLQEEGPEPRELEKVKNAARAQFVRQLRTIDGKASVIADTDAFFGGWERLGERLAAIEAITAADVKRVMRTYFTRRNRTVATLEVGE